MPSFHVIRRLFAMLGALVLAMVIAVPALGHEQRDINGFSFEVGLIDEPVYVGNKSGLEFFVKQSDKPVEGLEKTIKATVSQGSATRELPISADSEMPGRYYSSFIPTAAGKYTFHLTGTLPDGSSVDQTFTSSPTGFNEVQEVASGQFPVQFPSEAELASQARAGSDAATQVTIALGLAAIGVIVGLAALGIVVAGRSRAR